MRFLAFIVLFFAAMIVAGLYGALHDQISYSVSAEYFTKFKYHQFGFTDIPLPDRAKAAAIGFLASWWMGIPIGLLVGAFGFIHRSAKVMLLSTLKAYGIVAVVALIVGLGGLSYGWFFASHQFEDYQGWYRPEGVLLQRNFLSVGHMHNFSYLGGLVGLLAGIVSQFIFRKNHRKQPASDLPTP